MLAFLYDTKTYCKVKCRQNRKTFRRNLIGIIEQCTLYVKACFMKLFKLLNVFFLFFTAGKTL